MKKNNRYREKLKDSAPIWAQRINDLLIETEMTQTELEQVSGVSDSTISSWIKASGNDNRNEPKIEGIIRIAKAFDVSIDYIAGLTDSRKKDSNHKMISSFLGISDNAIDWLHRRQRERRSRQTYLSKGRLPIPKEYKQLDLELFNYIFEKKDFLRSLDTALYNYIELLVKNGYPKAKLMPETENEISHARYAVMRTVETLLDDMYHDLYEKYAIQNELRK